jgi:hypothetical protein
LITVEIEVGVMDGQRLVQRWPCRTGTLPDGSPGAWWRGVLYPLLPDAGQGGTIDIGVPNARPVLSAHAVLAGEETSWVLIQGDSASLEAARSVLISHGIIVSRHGRWLGEPVNGQGFDFFLRCDGALDPSVIAALLASPGRKTAEIDPAVQIGLLEQRLANMRVELAGLRAVLTRMESAAAVNALTRQPPELPLQATVLYAELQEAVARADAFEARLATEPSPVSRGHLKLKDELADALAALRPDLVLLRDTLVVITGEFATRTGTLRAIAELPASGSRPEGWKMLRGAERWWERHVNTGRNDLGRAYARFDTQTRCWNLLVGMKGSQ